MIRVELCLVHLGNGGEHTYEAMFVDDDGCYGRELLVSPDGTMVVVTEIDYDYDEEVRGKAISLGIKMLPDGESAMRGDRLTDDWDCCSECGAKMVKHPSGLCRECYGKRDEDG